MYKTTLKTYLEIKKTIEASKPEILPYMLQIKLFSVKASSVKFGGSRDTKLPFQILQEKSANRAQGDGAFQTSIARRAARHTKTWHMWAAALHLQSQNRVPYKRLRGCHPESSLSRTASVHT